MKKLIFFTIAILSAVTMYAQNNSSVVEATGSENKATVVQTGLENTGEIYQEGNRNEAILKEGISTAASDFADGKIDQSGDGNYGEINISGEYHNIPGHGITQVQLGAGLAGNRAVVNQSGENNDMDVLQVGTDNQFNGLQNGGEINQFMVEQEGVSNRASITQNGDWNALSNKSAWGTNPEAVIWNTLHQEGSSNTAHITQEDLNLFTLYQIGNENMVKAEQGFNTILEIRQVGDKNIVGGLLNSVPTDVLVLDNAATVDALQNGDNNKLYVNTAGDLYSIQNNGGTAGIGNTIRYAQVFEGYVELTQLGDENLIKLKNNSNANIDMDVDVFQDGNKNTLAEFENGVVKGSASFAGERLDIDQFGTENSIHLISTGSLNVVEVMQNGMGNWSSVIQN